MKALATVVLLQMAAAPRLTNANELDRHHQARDHGNPHFLLQFVSAAALIGVLAFVMDMALSYGP